MRNDRSRTALAFALVVNWFVVGALICGATVGVAAEAGTGDTLPPRLKPMPAAAEIQARLAAHREWLRTHELEAPGAWKGRSWEQLRAIFQDKRRGDFSKTDLRGAVLEGAVLTGVHFDGADLSGARLNGADLSKANLTGAVLVGAQLKGAKLIDATLQRTQLGSAILAEADFSEANAAYANLTGVDLRGAVFTRTTLAHAQLDGADLTGARLVGSDLKNASMEGATLENVLWELRVGGLPNAETLGRARGLDRLSYARSPASLLELRESFKKAGLRSAERAVTYSVRKTDRQLQWREGFQGKVESVFTLVCFELPCAYGLRPGRPLLLILAFIGLFAMAYTFALWRPGMDGIWRIWERERIRQDIGGPAERLQLSGLRAVPLAFYFSCLSAFRMGWKDLNVGNWIARMQPQEMNLHGSGWVRLLSGLQSVLSVYLLALWALSYFGRPFE